MKNRILLFILIVILLFSLVACSQTTTEKTDKDDTQTTESLEDDDKVETETTTAEETEMTIEEKLLSGYWYLSYLEISGYFVKFKFNNDGTCDGVVLKYPFVENMEGECEIEWEYDDKSKELTLFSQDSKELIKFYYNESNDWFQMDYEKEYWPNEDEIPEEFSKIYEDGMNIYLFPCEENFSSLDVKIFNRLLTVIYGYGDYSYIYNLMAERKEKSKIQMDKAAIAELYQAIKTTMVYSIYEDVKVNQNPVKVNKNGDLFIAELFDTSNSVGRDFATEVECTIDTEIIEFRSSMKNDCTIQIVKFDTERGIVVIQIISEDAGLEYYIDSFGEHEGIYINEETDLSERPSLEDYGSGEILIWVPSYAADFTERIAKQFIAEHKKYSGYRISVECVSEADAVRNVIDVPHLAADIYCLSQDRVEQVVLAEVLTPLEDIYADYVEKNNIASTVTASQINGQTYAFPITADNGYFMYYDKSVITNPNSLEQIIADCEKAGKSISFEVNNGWYQTAFFFGTGCVLEYEIDKNDQFVNCNIDYNSKQGLVALRELIDLTSSPAFVNGSSVVSAVNPGVVISGVWSEEDAVKKFVDAEGNSVLGVAKLPEFKGCDGNTYQLSGFMGCSLLGVKPQQNEGKSVVCMELAKYLTSEEVQLERYRELGWVPSNLDVINEIGVQDDAVVSALLAQSKYMVPQRLYPGDYWSRSLELAEECISKKLNPSTSDEELMNVLEQFQNDCRSYVMK